ncbi:hypothetical protein GGR56DRAFT_640171 [Xylariaceae sp. FL0804]|nr:hypothetical protein GGR56DRAFT_640171 [Xylariaceae sp. FL0804]
MCHYIRNCTQQFRFSLSLRYLRVWVFLVLLFSFLFQQLTMCDRSPGPDQRDESERHWGAGVVASSSETPVARWACGGDAWIFLEGQAGLTMSALSARSKQYVPRPWRCAVKLELLEKPARHCISRSIFRGGRSHKTDRHTAAVLPRYGRCARRR